MAVVDDIINEKEEENPEDTLMCSNGAIPSPVKTVPESDDAQTFYSFPVGKHSSFADSYKSGQLSDKDIDDNYKVLLAKQRNGAYLSPEIVAHLEYFMNTLNLGLKSLTENPFENLAKYPALQYKGESKVSQFSKSYLNSELYDSEESEEDDCLIDIDALEEDSDRHAVMELGIAKIQSSNLMSAKKLEVPNKESADPLAKSLPKGKQQPKMTIEQEIKR